MPRNYIEFVTECTTERSVSSAHGGAFLKTPVDEIDGKISTLIIDNEPAEVDASVVPAAGRGSSTVIRASGEPSTQARSDPRSG